MHHITNNIISGNDGIKPKNTSFHMETAQRTAGSVPVYENRANYNDNIKESSDITQKNQDNFGFADLLDMVNPLQHIPVISTFYRHITGDEIKPVSRIFGGAFFGGVIGAASGILNAAVESETGSDIASNLVMSINSPSKKSEKFASVNNAAYHNLHPDTSFILSEANSLPNNENELV